VTIFYAICLFASYVHYELLFFMALLVLLCFRWMHFQWCGFVYACALINVDQRLEMKMKIKIKTTWAAGTFFFTKFQQFVWR